MSERGADRHWEKNQNRGGYPYEEDSIRIKRGTERRVSGGEIKRTLVGQRTGTDRRAPIEATPTEGGDTTDAESSPHGPDVAVGSSAEATTGATSQGKPVGAIAPESAGGPIEATAETGREQMINAINARDAAQGEDDITNEELLEELWGYMSAAPHWEYCRACNNKAAPGLYPTISHDNPNSCTITRRYVIASSRFVPHEDNCVYAMIAARLRAEPVGERIEGWAAQGRTGWEFAADDGTFTPGPTSRRAVLILQPTPEETNA